MKIYMHKYLYNNHNKTRPIYLLFENIFVHFKYVWDFQVQIGALFFRSKNFQCKNLQPFLASVICHFSRNFQNQSVTDSNAVNFRAPLTKNTWVCKKPFKCIQKLRNAKKKNTRPRRKVPREFYTLQKPLEDPKPLTTMVLSCNIMTANMF